MWRRDEEEGNTPEAEVPLCRRLHHLVDADDDDDEEDANNIDNERDYYTAPSSTTTMKKGKKSPSVVVTGATVPRSALLLPIILLLGIGVGIGVGVVVVAGPLHVVVRRAASSSSSTSSSSSSANDDVPADPSAAHKRNNDDCSSSKETTTTTTTTRAPPRQPPPPPPPLQALSERRKPGVLNVHIVPHTHDDVGWLKTVDQYYVGSNSSIQQAAVRHIITGVVDALLKDANKTFTYVEMAFFARWWREQSEERRAQVRDLVSQDRLSFANGGWCMHDEAAAHYADMIDQTALGHEFLRREFGRGK